MSLVKISRYADATPNFDNSCVSRIPVLVGTYSQTTFTRTAIKQNGSFEPELYEFGDKVQIFLFFSGRGYITTPRDAFNIDETCVFVPDFDKEKIIIHAAKDNKVPLEFLHITALMSEYDKKDIYASHMTLPRFRGFSKCWTYDECFKEEGTKSLMLLEHRNLGRLSMGAVLGCGPSTVGQHIHNELEQWYFALPGASFTYTAEGEKYHLTEGDLSYTPHSSHHGSSAAAGERFDYIWFELCENGYPGGIA